MKRIGLAVIALLGLGAALAASWAADDAPPRSGHPPVVVLVLDEFPVTSLLDERGRIDGKRFPNFATLARKGTWFPHAVASHDRTTYAVPALLTGRYPRRGSLQDYCFHRQNLFTLLNKHGYAVRAVEPSTALWPPYSCRPVHHKKLARGFLFSSRRSLVFERWVRSIHSTRRPTLWFQHAFLPHMPWQYLPSGRTYGKKSGVGGPRWAPGLNTPAGFHDRYLVRLAYARHVLQVGYVDRLLGALIKRLRDSGVYERALVVVTADHGIAFHLNHDRRAIDSSNVTEVGPVPLFMKLPGQRRGRIVRRPVEAVDLLPTIASVLRLSARRPMDGRSALDRRARSRRSVAVYPRSWKRLRVPVARLLRDTRAATRRKVRLFGAGDRGSPYRFWVNQGLIGRRPGAFGARTARGVRARIAPRRWLRSADLRSGVVPTLVHGVVGGGHPGAERQLALAVNGRIAATGKSYHLRGDPREFFALLAPEESFVSGANRVELFAVTRQRGRLRLARLGGVG